MRAFSEIGLNCQRLTYFFSNPKIGTDCYLGPSPICRCFCPADDAITSADICRKPAAASQRISPKAKKRRKNPKAWFDGSGGGRRGGMNGGSDGKSGIGGGMEKENKGSGESGKEAEITTNDVTWDLEQEVRVF